MNVFAQLIDCASNKICAGENIFLGVDSLPVWVKRYFVAFRRIHGAAPTGWTMGEITTCAEEDKIESYFKTQFPRATWIGFEATQEAADELNEIFFNHLENNQLTLEYAEIIRRACDRGISLSLTDSDTKYLDLFQHIKDELERLKLSLK